MKALKTSDYGLCVFHANNDVVDHQVVNLEFEGGATASLTMNAFNYNYGGRYIRVYGTKGAPALQVLKTTMVQPLTQRMFQGKYKT